MPTFIITCEYCENTLTIDAADFPFNEETIDVTEEDWETDGAGGYWCSECEQKEKK